MDRTLHTGYLTGLLVFAFGLFATLAIWRRREGSISVSPITCGRVEVMFRIAALFSNAIITRFTFIRPFSASFGDLLTKPIASDGLNLAPCNASVVCLALIIAMVWMAQRRALRTAS